MRHGNLSDGGHDKVTWKPSRDLLTSCCSNRTQETQWRCTTVMLWCVSFKSYRRCYRGILMDRHDFEPLRCLGDIPLRCCWLFHLTYLRHCGDVLMGHCHFVLLRHHNNIPIKILWRCTTETSWQHSTETLMGLSFEAYLQCHWDIQGDIFRLSSQHLVAGWDIILIQGWPKAMVLDCLYKPFYHEINWKYHCLISRPVYLKQMQRIIVSINIKKTLHYKK